MVLVFLAGGIAGYIAARSADNPAPPNRETLEIAAPSASKAATTALKLDTAVPAIQPAGAAIPPIAADSTGTNTVATVPPAAPVFPPSNPAQTDTASFPQHNQLLQIQVSAELDSTLAVDRRMGRRPTVSELFDQLSQEERDGAWADVMEHHLRQEFMGKMRELEIKSIECRQSLCQLQAVASFPQPSMIWGGVLQMMLEKKPWGREILIGPRAVTNEVGKAHILQIFLRRTSE